VLIQRLRKGQNFFRGVCDRVEVLLNDPVVLV